MWSARRPKTARIFSWLALFVGRNRSGRFIDSRRVAAPIPTPRRSSTPCRKVRALSSVTVLESGIASRNLPTSLGRSGSEILEVAGTNHMTEVSTRSTAPPSNEFPIVKRQVLEGDGRSECSTARLNFLEVGAFAIVEETDSHRFERARRSWRPIRSTYERQSIARSAATLIAFRVFLVSPSFGGFGRDA